MSLFFYRGPTFGLQLELEISEAGQESLRRLDFVLSDKQRLTDAPRSPLERKLKRQLDAYFEGRLTAFDLPLHLQGTPFQRAVWEATAGIPYGHTQSYGQLAARIGRPRGARAVGQALNRNPLALFVPCHRVLGAGGTLGGFAVGGEVKRTLLGLEARWRNEA